MVEPDTGVMERYFLSNPARILLFLIEHPQATVGRVARHVDLTERTVQRIIRDLETQGYMTRRRAGRNNEYHVVSERVLPLLWWTGEVRSIPTP